MTPTSRVIAPRLLRISICVLVAVTGLGHNSYPNPKSDSAVPQSEIRNPQSAIGWREAAEGFRFSFPRDHGSHPDYRIEWWYYTGNVETKEGRRFGYQLTFFRTGVVREPDNPSRRAIRDLFMAHFAISDIDQQSFHSCERINRSGIGWAGADTAAYRAWNEEWEAKLDVRDHLLTAVDGDYSIELRLAPQKNEVIHGIDSISQKGPAKGNASHYYSLTRLDTEGRITVPGGTFQVTGQSWMDHEFGSSFLEEQQVGWDWFSIQLNDGRELMLSGSAGGWLYRPAFIGNSNRCRWPQHSCPVWGVLARARWIVAFGCERRDLSHGVAH
jgi:predicted secreted hydrolase